MKIQCELCKEIVAADFSIVAGGIEVRCPACSKSFEVAASRRDEPAPRPSGDLTCPKCGDVQPPAPACRSCGLLADKMEGFERARDAGVPPEVAAAWEAVDAGWDDPATHERFVDAAAGAQAFAWAAQRYRAALRLHPDDARATEQLARLTRMAEATLMVSSTPRTQGGPKPYRNVVILLVALVVLISVGVLYAAVATTQREDPPLRPPAHKKQAPKQPR